MYGPPDGMNNSQDTEGGNGKAGPVQGCLMSAGKFLLDEMEI